MENKGKVLILIVLVKCISGHDFGNLSERTFPADFQFGVATSAYQVEGAWNISNKCASNWDHFTHTKPDLIKDKSNGDIACDSYNKLNEDIKILKDLGVDFYRFSLSWTRLIPDPFRNKINPDGIRYYNKLIDLLLKNGIKPMVTIFHFDLPESLQELGGFTNLLLSEYFVRYAKVAFENFGDRVKIWTTFNEPHILCLLGYGQDLSAPAYNLSGIAEYLCSHNILKAHAEVYHLYNDTFRSRQEGVISINFDSAWFEPASYSIEDIEASKRAMEFELGLYAHPIFSKEGDYPTIVKEFIAKRSAQEGFEQSRLPQFSQKEVRYIRGTHDNIFCLNHYTSKMAKSKIADPIGDPSFERDRNVNSYDDPSWPSTAFPVNKVVPWGFKKVLIWVKQHYGDPIIYVTENGFSDNGEIDDQARVDFYKSYLNALLEAVYQYSVRVKGYTAWSLMDNFEWMNGYTLKFGLYHVDFSNSNRTRTEKSSAKYYRRVIETRKP